MTKTVQVHTSQQSNKGDNGNNKSSDDKSNKDKGKDGVRVHGWVAAMHWATVVAKDTGYHGWGENLGLH